MQVTTRKNIACLIEHIGQQFVEKYKLTSVADISNGYCEEFAQQFIKLLGKPQGSPAVDMYGVEEFMNEKGTKFDWALLTSPRWNIYPPAGFNQVGIDALNLGGHLWIIIGREHFDAESPNGVASFFDLPFFQRQIARKSA